MIVERTTENGLDNPLISIGIPVVKSMFLKDAINCAISQTYYNIEIIILNNASSSEMKDEIQHSVEAFCDNRIKYFCNESQLPIIENWNKLVSLSNGLFFSLLSDDDFWDKEFIQNLYQLSLKYTTCNIFHSRIAVVDELGVIKRVTALCNEFEDSVDFIWHRIKGFREQYVTDFMVKTDELKSLGGFYELPGAWGSDDLTWFNMALSGGVAYSSDVLFYYRESNVNITSTMSVGLKIEACRKYFINLKQLIAKIPTNNQIDSVRKMALQKEAVVYYESQLTRWYSQLYHRKFLIPIGWTYRFFRFKKRLKLVS